jgi:anaerobic selenocysteine-containing dehydrogenase
VTPEFFAAYTVSELERQSDYWLEEQGRLTEPMRYNSATDHYEPTSWDDAFAIIGAHLRALESPDRADFYTSGRASNESAFLYQIFVRRFGTNNFPDCSNMCHEPTSVGLPESIGIGKGHRSAGGFRQNGRNLCDRAESRYEQPAHDDPPARGRRGAAFQSWR